MKVHLYLLKFLFLFLTPIILFSCSEEDNTLAPYSGGRPLSDIIIQDESFNPEVTWVGGYVSVFGVNRGNKAALDSSLVWLIHTAGNNLKFPVIVGQVPSGAQNITSQFGGTSIDSLSEDESYTFWVLKEDLWNQVSSYSNKEFIPDSSITSVTVSGDTVIIPHQSFTRGEKSINVYINLKNIQALGPLADLFVEGTLENFVRVSWKIKAPGVTDSLVAAIGLAKDQNYDPSGAMWEVYSERDSAGVKIYARDNVIPGPATVGENFPGTRTFIEFDPAAFERNANYHIWIADKTWDREKRDRSTPGYAFIRFRVE